jgi:hypothetical protein
MKEQNDQKLSIRRKRFKEYGARKVTNMLNSLDSLRSFAQKTNYDAKPDELNQIIQALRKKIDEIEKVFKNDKDEKNDFTFK